MASSKTFEFFSLLILSMQILISAGCTDVRPCDCTTQKMLNRKVERIVSCRYRNLSHVPNLKYRNFSLPVTSLELNFNHITTIDRFSFEGMSIKEINLDNNPIRRIDAEAFAGIDGLQKLSMVKCRMNAFPVVFQHTPNLTRLDLRQNFITNIPDGAFMSVRNLDRLDISFNPLTLTSASFRGLENSLTSICLQGTRLRDVPRESLSPLRSLDWIDLSYNSILYLDNDSLAGLPNNKHTHYGFSSNGMSSISDAAFANASLPIFVDLSSNNLTSVNFVTDPCRFEHSTLYLDDNPIHCGCELYDLLKYETFTVRGVCHTPDEFERYDLLFNKHIFQPFVIPFLRYASKKCGGNKVLGMDYDCDCKIWRKPRDFMKMRGNCTAYKFVESGATVFKIPDFFCSALMLALFVNIY
ncbi:keratocan-like [Tubulanus polymorphus]|uniref:keratocan-like n=1 Tax=Tubulanus polymorphus TaxID=672921 RepID=UPI003DA6A2BD